MKKLIVLLTLLFQLTITAFAQNKSLPVFEAKTIEVNTNSLRTNFRHYSALTLKSKQLSEFVSRNIKSSFRLDLGSDKQWDIDLEPSGIVADNYRLKVLVPAGMQNLSSHPGFLFKGKVRGSNKEEQVRLAIKEGFVYGSIQAGGKEYFIEPMSRFTMTKQKDEYIVYESNDIIRTESFSCGVQDKTSALKKVEEDQTGLKEHSPLDIICKKIKFISIADYSMFQKFGSDVYTVETSLLSILNLAEGAYTTLNFGADGSTDVGTDKLQFEMEEVVVSTCSECDIAPGEENASTMISKVINWASKNINDRGGKVIQHWTTNGLFAITGMGLSGTAGSAGCYGISPEILRYGTDDPAFLRVLVAHETGHTLGCIHDNEIKSSVTGFIMYGGADGTRTRFSTLADFGGGNYSSQQVIRNNVLANINCLADCGSNSCSEVKDLKIDYGNFDKDAQLSWTGNGSFLVKYKINDSSSYDPANIVPTNLNTISLKGLDPCTLYNFEVQRNCGSSLSKGSAIIFKTSSLTVNSKPVNLHGDKYDLQLDLDCKRCSDKDYFIKIDGVVQKAANTSSLKQIFFKDLFADGARHRIDVSKDSGNAACAATLFYTAPYYRSSSKKLLNSDLNDCVMPSGWKDSLLAKRNAAAPDARWLIAEQNFFVSRTPRGSLDSTCMIYYNNFNTSRGAYSGALSLTSPKIDLTRYKNIKLHYDYNFLGYKFPNSQPVGSITVEAFDGSNWQKLFERQADIPNGLTEIWDSVPQRVFVDLDSFKSNDFQVRFIVDDGSLINRGTLGVFAAFDNIVVDGYLKDSSANNDIIVYPNPTNGEVFVQFSQQPLSDITYRLIDVNGNVVKKGTLINYRISMNSLSGGTYLCEFYSEGKRLTVKKVLKL